jgi:hypothetical protein
MDRSNAFPVSGEDGISPPKPLLIGRLGAERILNRKSFESKFGHLSNTNKARKMLFKTNAFEGQNIVSTVKQNKTWQAY